MPVHGAADVAAAPHTATQVKLSLWVGKEQEIIYLFVACDPPCVRGVSLTSQAVLGLFLSFLPVVLVTPPSLGVLEDIGEMQNIQGEEKA